MYVSYTARRSPYEMHRKSFRPNTWRDIYELHKLWKRYKLHMKSNHMNFMYKFHMLFLMKLAYIYTCIHCMKITRITYKQSTYEVYMFFIWNSQQFHMKFIWKNSYKIHIAWLCFSYGNLHMNFICDTFCCVLWYIL